VPGIDCQKGASYFAPRVGRQGLTPQRRMKAGGAGGGRTDDGGLPIGCRSFPSAPPSP